MNLLGTVNVFEAVKALSAENVSQQLFIRYCTIQLHMITKPCLPMLFVDATPTFRAACSAKGAAVPVAYASSGAVLGPSSDYSAGAPLPAERDYHRRVPHHL